MSAANPAAKRSRPAGPHIKLTRYDIAVSVMQTSALIAALAFIVMLAIWLSNLLPTPISKKVELMPAGDGGWEDGTPDATPNVESPEDAVPDPSMANEETDVTQIEEVIEQVVEVAENAAVIEAPNENTQRENSGIPGSADGTGGRPLGSGGPGRGGAKREQGWIVEFAEKGDIDTYAAQLDFFGIELGLLLKEESRLVYLSNFSQPQPTRREVRTGDAEKRLFLACRTAVRNESKPTLNSSNAQASMATPGSSCTSTHKPPNKCWLNSNSPTATNRPQRSAEPTSRSAEQATVSNSLSPARFSNNSLSSLPPLFFPAFDIRW
ncbi:MAG UNVERIFIED_CONTAM: hypothetical protein LVR18_32865 [Planctomycetaceae bacterium]|jgi:hypothetical protein